MFPSNDFIDSFREKIFSEIQDEKERRFSCYGIAQLYFQVGGYELAQKYVTEYLLVQHKSAAAHKFLGQCYEALGQKESALETFKRSLQLDDKQDDLVLKICELLVNPDVSADFSQFLYWTERAESKYPDNPVVLELKKKLITNNESGDTDLEEIKTEISIRPSDINLQVKLIKHLISKQQMKDAYEYAIKVQCTYAHHQSFIWYECFYDLLTKMKDYKNSDSLFWIFLITASERCVALALAEDGDKAKNVSEVMQMLLDFDQDMYEFDMSLGTRLPWKQILDHMFGQFNFHLGCMLLRSAKTEVTIWQDTAMLCCPLFYTATQCCANLTYYRGIFKNDQIKLWKKEGSYRYSQAGHMLEEYRRNDSGRLWKIIHYSLGTSWREKTFRKLITGRYNEKLINTSYFLNNCKVYPEQIEVPSPTELKEFDLKVGLIYPDSLHPEIIEYYSVCCQFVKPADQFIPRELVMRSDREHKKFIESLLANNFTIHPNSNRDKDFVYAAVENGHLQIVGQLLELAIDVNMVNSDTGLNLLAIACLNKHHEIVRTLLEHQVDVNVQLHSANVLLNDQWRTYHNMHVFNRLLSLFPTDYHLSNVTCLHLAVMNSDPEMTRLLLEHGATIIDDPNFFKITSIAAKQGCAKIVELFLDHGLNVADIGSEGENLLSLYLRDDIDSDFGYDTIKLLLEKGAATFYIQTPGNSLVFDAIKNKHHKIAHLFLDYNANVGYIGPDNDTVLLRAVQDKIGIEFINKLLKLNVAVDAANNKGLTPLSAACQDPFSDHLELVKTLVHYNANINCADDDLRTPLHFVCNYRNLEMVTVLVENGANIIAKNKYGRTPLHYTCGYGDHNIVQIIQLLLQYGANIEAVDNDGWTPLFVAIHNCNDEAVKYLLKNNANVNHTDLKGLTPLFIATQKCHEYSKIVEILSDHEINIHCVDELGNSEVHNTVNAGKDQFIRSLSHTLVDFNSVNKKGNTPLHIAVKKNLLEMTENLIKYGSDINILDSDDNTPLQKAVNIISFPVKKFDITSMLKHSLLLTKQKKLIKILKTEVIKLKVAGLNVHDQNLDIVYGSDADITDYLKDFYENHADEEVPKLNIRELEVNCEREINAMKVESIGNTGMTNNITFFDLLKEDIHYLSKLAKNENIEKTLKLEVYDEKFPMYINIVRNRFREAKLRCRLIDCITTMLYSDLNSKELNVLIEDLKSSKK